MTHFAARKVDLSENRELTGQLYNRTSEIERIINEFGNVEYRIRRA
jgi:hypothetical protein